MRGSIFAVLLLWDDHTSAMSVPTGEPAVATSTSGSAALGGASIEPLSGFGEAGSAAMSSFGEAGSAAVSFLRGRRLGRLSAPAPMSPNQIIIYGAIAIGIASMLAGVAIMGARYYVESCTTDYYDTAAPGPVWAGDDSIQVYVHANGQEAELEVRADGFDSYEMLRELVVDSLQGMFDDSDEIVLDYLDEKSRWVRVKTRTPLETLKSSGSVKISVRSSHKSNKALVEQSRKKKSRSRK